MQVATLVKHAGLAVAAAVLTAWCGAAAAYAPRGPSAATGAVAALVVVLATSGLVAWWRGRGRAKAAGAMLACVVWGATLAWFWWVPAPRSGDWLPECAVAPVVTTDGTGAARFTVHGIRDFRYLGTDRCIEPNWNTRTFDLNQLRTVDLFCSFWGPTLICHNFVTFGFETPNGWDHVAVSIEVRKRRGQSYSAVGGLFRQFGLVFIWAEERDVVRVRTNFRGETVRRYRLLLTDAQARNLFLHYLEETRRLHGEPRWYNAVTQSCGVDIIRTASGDRMGLFPTPWQLLNGTWERRAWDFGRLGPAATFEEELASANITADAEAAPWGTAPEFSAAIRRRDTTWRPAVDIRGRP
jgi:hypothetical protein